MRHILCTTKEQVEQGMIKFSASLIVPKDGMSVLSPRQSAHIPESILTMKMW
ncbi:hypothetical protein QG37_06888 [Candidozyma auris]|uniref:Uncharacterized protein n=1 Tax=Candidozyma auris TaxID=498019 RepID=A0A0L0NSX2_CANAR|nr:hypothetical protein QG37_06888 [[Candida] auris]